ncbi:MAG: universal stress protein [Spirochaetales bacterium]|nr:universal stress protein [Spirochaetales bacterium]
MPATCGSFRKQDCASLIRSIESGDRLIIVGETDSFRPVCTLLECDSPHFPLAYGRGVLVAMLPGEYTQQELLDEALYLTRQTTVSHVEVVCAEDHCDLRSKIQDYSHVYDMQVDSGSEALLRRVARRVDEASIGCVVVPPFQPALINRMLRPPLVGLAHTVGCPVLVARNSAPYKRILVPFHKNPVGELTLEVALDFAKQVGAEVTVIIVEEEEFIHGEEWTPDPEALTRRVREIAHTHKVKLDVVVRSGNPVKEIMAESESFDLLVVASSTDRKGLFFPHVGEMLTEGAACSVLVVTS